MEKISGALYRVSVWMIILIIIVMSVVTLLEVFTRNILGFSISWSGELARFLFIWVTFVGASAVHKRLEMPAFDMITDKLSPKVSVFTFKTMQVFILLFSAAIIYAGFKQSFSPTVLLQNSPSLNISMTIPYLGIPVGMSFLFIHAFTFLIGNPNKSKEVDL